MSPVFLPHELIIDVLSFLPVKSLLRFNSVCKSWKTLISDPTFIKLHLNRSKRNKHLALFSTHIHNFTVVRSPISRLLENNTSITLPIDSCLQLNDDNGYLYVIGSYNGLLCLVRYFYTDDYGEITFYLWNPATRKLSKKIVFLEIEIPPSYINSPPCRFLFKSWNFEFGYDNSTDTYKIVAFRLYTKEVRVFTFGDNVWRNIQSFPELPLQYVSSIHHHHYDLLAINGGVCVSGTINWLAIRNESKYQYESGIKFVTVDQFLIISLDLSTETYRHIVLPRGFTKMLVGHPTLSVLIDSLCFSHDFNGTNFIIWQMKEYGVEESWIKFLKISYERISIDNRVLHNWVSECDSFVLLPLCLSKNGDTLILTSCMYDQAILYNLRDKRVEKTRLTNEIGWLLSKDYVESLVSTC